MQLRVLQFMPHKSRCSAGTFPVQVVNKFERIISLIEIAVDEKEEKYGLFDIKQLYSVFSSKKLRLCFAKSFKHLAVEPRIFLMILL